MKRSDGPALDASNENAIGIILMALDKVTGSLFSWDGNERHTLVGGLEPYDLWFILLAVLVMAARIAFTLLPLGLLFLFGSLAARPQQTQSPGDFSRFLSREQNRLTQKTFARQRVQQQPQHDQHTGAFARH